jgi:hypothetical protein
MNERIKQLAEQAGYLPDGFGIGHWDMPECKKFAELIVRECLKACSRANEITYLVPPSKGQVVVSCMREIEKHFGVEE